jgi:serine/threonine protein kinase
MEVVPGYTLLSPLGSGMAGDVWIAQAAGGIKVALKIVRSLSVLGGRKELKALKIIRDVHHPNLCPLFGFWTKDAEGRILADGETEELSLDSSSVIIPDDPSGHSEAGMSAAHGGLGGTMAVGQYEPTVPPADATAGEPSEAPSPTKERKKAEQLIVVMGLGDCTLYDRLRYVRQEAGLTPDETKVACGLDAAETVRYLRASASAIDLLNREHQIYHCDIKPQNILLVGGEAQVCDFGLAKRIEGDMRQTQQAFATPAYAAPEVLHQEGYSRQVDQYSLAVTYFELRTGLLPFDVTTHASMLVAKSTGKLDLTALSPAERKVMQKALSRDPNKRYGSCAEFVDAIAVAAGVDKAGGITVGRMLAGAAILLLLTLAGLGIWWTVDEPSFRQTFFRVEADMKSDLAEAEIGFQGTERKDYVASLITLDSIIDNTASISQRANGDLKRKSVALFSDANLRLAKLFHQSLDKPLSLQPEQREMIQGLWIMWAGERQEYQLTQPAGATDSGQKKDNSPAIQRTMELWAESAEPELAERYGEFESARAAATTRFSIQQERSVVPADLNTLRAAVKQAPAHFEPDKYGGPVLAAMLPLFATVTPDAAAKLSARDWTDAELLSDVIRAELATKKQGPPERHRSRWFAIRNAFTFSMSKSLKGTDAVSEMVSAEDRDRIFEAFPDLYQDALLVQLRRGAEDQDWTTVRAALTDLRGQTDLPGGMEPIMELAESLADSADRPEGLGDVIFSANALLATDSTAFNEWLPAIQATLDSTAERLLKAVGKGARIDKSLLDEAVRFEGQIPSIQLRPALFAAALIDVIVHQPDKLVDQSVDSWLSRVGGSDGPPLKAAIQIERLLAAQPSGKDQTDVDPDQLATWADTSKQASWQEIPVLGNAYGLFLQSAASAIAGKQAGAAGLAPERVTEKLEAFEPNESRAIDLTRWRKLATACVRAAVSVSGVADDDFLHERYQEQSQREVAVAFLKLAERWQQLTGFASLPRLEREQFLIEFADRVSGTAAEGSRLENLGELTFPVSVGDALRNQQLPDDCSVPFLFALHECGLAKLRAMEAGGTLKASGRGRLVTALLITPTLAIVEHDRAPKFRFNDGRTDDKRRLLESLLLPTFKKGILPGLVPDNGNPMEMRVADESELPMPAIRRLAMYLTEAVMDPTAASNLSELERRSEQVMIAAALSAGDSNRQSKTKQLHWMFAGWCGLQQPNLDPDHVRFALEHAKAAGPPRSEIAILAARAHLRHADQAALVPNLELQLEQLHLASRTLIAEIERLERTPETERSNANFEDLFTANADAASLDVRIGFLINDRIEKEQILKLGVDRIEDALRYSKRPGSSDRVLPSLAPELSEVYLTRGNLYEDLAYYCYVDPQDDPAQQQSFDDAIMAFRQAVERSEQSVKARYSLARCLYRKALANGDDDPEKQRLLNLARKESGAKPRIGAGNDLDAAHWLLWRIKIASELSDKAEFSEFTKEGIRLARREDLGDTELRSQLARMRANAIAIVDSEYEEAIDLLYEFLGVGSFSEEVFRAGALIDLQFRLRKKLDRLPTILQSIAKQRNVRFSDRQEEAYVLTRLSTYCVRELMKDSEVAEKYAADLEDAIAGAFEKIDARKGPAHYQLNRVYHHYASSTATDPGEKELLLADELGRFLRRTSDMNDFLVSDSYLTMFEAMLLAVAKIDSDNWKARINNQTADRFDGYLDDMLVKARIKPEMKEKIAELKDFLTGLHPQRNQAAGLKK